MDAYIDAAMPLVSTALTAIITAIAGWVAKKYGIKVNQTSLHSALLTGARLAAHRQLTGPSAIALIVQYAKESVPDAMSKLNPTETVLTNLAESKIQQVKTEVVNVAQDKLTDAMADALNKAV